MKCPICEVNLILDTRPKGRVLYCPECCQRWCPVTSGGTESKDSPTVRLRRVGAGGAPEKGPNSSGRGEDLFEWF